MTGGLRVSRTVLNCAKTKLDELQRLEEGHNDEDGIVLATNVAMDDFIRFSNKKLLIQARLLDGTILAYEVPTDPHAVTTYAIINALTTWSPNHLVGGTRTDCIVDTTTMLQCDGQVKPPRLPRPSPGQGLDTEGSPYPTLVAEVGYSESLGSLHSLAPLYFSPRTTVQIYLAIKIFPVRGDGTQALLALLYLRNNLIPVVRSFGTAPIHSSTRDFLARIGVQNILGVGYGGPPCNAPGIYPYQLNIPAIPLFFGSPHGIPPNAMGGCDLDLYAIVSVLQ